MEHILQVVIFVFVIVFALKVLVKMTETVITPRGMKLIRELFLVFWSVFRDASRCIRHEARHFSPFGQGFFVTLSILPLLPGIPFWFVAWILGSSPKRK